jgi:predicted branched-subunit amino acid permease
MIAISTTPIPRLSTPRPFIDGAAAMGPWLVGIVPFGLTIGMTIGAGPVAPSVGLATGVTIYSGSAQLAAIDLLGQGAAPVVVIAAVLAINARLVFYSGSMAAHWRGTSRRFRALASYLLVDPSYAVGKAGYLEPGARGHAFYLGAAGALWVAWQGALVTGLVVGESVPAGLRLDYAVPLFLVAEVAHRARTRPAITAGIVGGATAVVGTSLPLHSGPLAGIVAGLAAAWVLDRCDP